MELIFQDQKPSTNYVFLYQQWVGRIAGDSPSGLVLVNGSPAARVVDLFRRAEKVLDDSTTSSGSGTYEFTDKIDLAEGYDVIIRGVISSGELDVIIPGVHPV